MPHSQELFNIPYQAIYSNVILSPTPRLPKDLFHVRLSVTILKALLPSSIPAT